jgi:hypothetical protein
MPTKSALLSYRRRVKESRCRGKSRSGCHQTTGCTLTRSGKRRPYCRKASIRRRRGKYVHEHKNRYNALSVSPLSS